MDLMDTAQLLGNFGEFVGAIAVVATLIYLTLQVRQNTSAIRRQTYTDLISRREAIFDTLSQSGELAGILARGMAGEPLAVYESQRFTYHLFNHMAHYQDCMIQHAAGIIEDSVWEAEKRLLGTALADKGFTAWWEQSQQFFTPEFAEFVSTLGHIGRHVSFDVESGEWRQFAEMPTESGE